MASKKINFKTISERAVKAAGLAGGVAASRLAGKVIATKIANPKINAGLRILAGAILPSLVGSSGKKDSAIHNVADGILTDGAVALGAAFGVPGLSGTGGADSISGDDYASLAYAAQQDAMSGTSGADSISGNLD